MYAPNVNRESCAEPGCYEPVEIEVVRAWRRARGKRIEEGTALIGYCSTHGLELQWLASAVRTEAS
jgi:hypothetical protein